MSGSSAGAPERARRAPVLLLVLVAVAAAVGGALLLAQGPTDDADASPTTTSTTTTGAPTTTAPTTTTSSTTTTTTTTTLPPLRHATAADPLLVWTLGDSTAQTIGEAIQIELRDDPTLAARTSFRISSGLARPDYFDWETFLALFTLAQTPDAVVISIGANDAQGVTAPDGSVHAFGTPGWEVEYRRRTDQAMALFTDAGMHVYWLGQPLAADVEYTRWMSRINTVYRAAAEANPDVDYLHTSSWLTDGEGHFAPELDGETVRAHDGIHLTYAGGTRVARRIVAEVRRDVAPPPPAPPSPATSLAPTTLPPPTTAAPTTAPTTAAPSTTAPAAP